MDKWQVPRNRQAGRPSELILWFYPVPMGVEMARDGRSP